MYCVYSRNLRTTAKLGAGILVLVERLALLGVFNSIGKAYNYSVTFSLAVVESLAAFRSPLVRRFHCTYIHVYLIFFPLRLAVGCGVQLV